MTPEEIAKMLRGECPSEGHHVFPNFAPVCQCGMVDVRNNPPRVECPMCGGTGEIQGDDAHE